MGWAERGPYKVYISWSAARPGPLNLQMMGHDPARPITFSKVSALPGPAHHILKTLGPAWPGPAIALLIFSAGTGPARPMMIFKTARPGLPDPHFRPTTCPAIRYVCSYTFFPFSHFFPLFPYCQYMCPWRREAMIAMQCHHRQRCSHPGDGIPCDTRKIVTGTCETHVHAGRSKQIVGLGWTATPY